MQATTMLAGTATQAPLRLAEAVIHDIFFPTDLLPRAEAALAHALLLTRALDARLTVHHVVVGPDQEAPWSAAREQASRTALSARDHLTKMLAGLTQAHDVTVDCAPRVRDAVIRRLSDTPADLVVLPTHGQEGLTHLHPWSVSDAVLIHATCPVLCVREPGHGVARPYRSMLVPTNLAPPSARAAAFASLLARTFSAEIIALYVVPPPALTTLSGVPDVVERIVPTDEMVRAALAPGLGDRPVAVHIRSGSPWEEIIAAARNERVDLVILSTHGHDSVGDRVLGSHAESVIRHSPCPVLVV